MSKDSPENSENSVGLDTRADDSKRESDHAGAAPGGDQASGSDDQLDKGRAANEHVPPVTARGMFAKTPSPSAVKSAGKRSFFEAQDDPAEPPAKAGTNTSEQQASIARRGQQDASDAAPAKLVKTPTPSAAQVSAGDEPAAPDIAKPAESTPLRGEVSRETEEIGRESAMSWRPPITGAPPAQPDDIIVGSIALDEESPVSSLASPLAQPLSTADNDGGHFASGASRQSTARKSSGGSAKPPSVRPKRSPAEISSDVLSMSSQSLDVRRLLAQTTPERIARRKKLQRVVLYVIAGAAGVLAVAIAARFFVRSSSSAPALETAVATEPASVTTAIPPVAEKVPDPAPTAAISVAAPASASALASASAVAPASAAPSSTASVPDGVNAKKEALKLLNLGKFKDAIPMAGAAIEQNPLDAECYLYLGSALQSVGRNKEAIEAYSKCVHEAKKGPVWECRAVGGH